MQGLAKESGDAYEIDENIPRMEQSSLFFDKIQTLLSKERRVVVMANVKVKHYSYGTLFSVEPRSKGVHFAVCKVIFVLCNRCLLCNWFIKPLLVVNDKHTKLAFLEMRMSLKVS